MKLDTKQLKELLVMAEKAHSEYEKKLGYRDKDWAVWYAKYIINRIK